MNSKCHDCKRELIGVAELVPIEMDDGHIYCRFCADEVLLDRAHAEILEQTEEAGPASHRAESSND